MDNDNLIFAFDIGTGSIGECVRSGDKILHLDSILLPPTFASVKELRKRRRQMRNRDAHRARENWWKEQAKSAGIEVLESRQPTKKEKKDGDIKPDERMLREFSADGDDTIYTSCLLRIALLQGRKLEGWQIYKAIWSAIQHRGYDDNLPWKRELRRNVENETEEESTDDMESEEKKDEKKNKEATGRFMDYVKKEFKGNEEYYYPCYFEAHRMGIWDQNEPNNLSRKIGTNPDPARNKENTDAYVYPRKRVEEELKMLLKMASEQYPNLKGKENYLIYGPAEKPYASYKDNEYRKYRGRNWDWQGLLAQKIPRFDNRNPTKCCLIPRYNTCKAGEPFNLEVTFLFKLKNMRYFDSSGKECSLTPNQIAELFNKYHHKELGNIIPRNVKPIEINGKKCALILRMKEREWAEFVKENLNGDIVPAHKKVEPPNDSGRSRFCRPALTILKDILLRGISPYEKHKELISSNTNTDKNKGLINDDYKFLLNMEEDWNKIYIPDDKTNYSELAEETREEFIEELFDKIKEPIVKHRLMLFKKELMKLKNKFGEPGKIIIEFVRDNFLGEKAKKRYEQWQRKNEKERKDASKKAEEIGLKGGKATLIMRLFDEQKGIDLYDLTCIETSKMNEYEIEHIVPRERGGPNAFYNLLLTTSTNNRTKGTRTPFEWLSESEKWQGILQKVNNNKEMSKKKKTLITSDKAEELVEKYTRLAETAYIAKLSQKISALFFGWDWQTEGSKRRIIIANGAQTAEIRRIYKLDRLLHPEKTDEKFKEMINDSSITKKNRENKKHHALDALVISMLPDISKGKLPAWFHVEFCKNALKEVTPHYVKYEKSLLDENIYGKRTVMEDGKQLTYAVSRFGEKSTIKYFSILENAKKHVDKIFDYEIRRNFQIKLEEKPAPTPEQWRQFVENYSIGSKPKKITIKKSKEIQGIELGENYKEIGKMSGQYFTDKEHKGYFIYLDKDNKWKVAPVYAFDSRHRKENELKETSEKIYFFNSKCLVEIQNDFNRTESGNEIIEKGKYTIVTVIENGSVKIQSNAGKVYLTSIKQLMEKGEMHRIDL